MAYLDEVNKEVMNAPKGANTYVQLSQNEDGRQLLFNIIGYDIPSGSTATLSGTKPDGVVYSTTGTVADNVVTINEDLQMTAVSGSWDAKIHIVNNGKTIATARVTFVVDADPVAPGSIPSDSQLDGIVAEVKMYAEQARSDAYGSPLTAATAADMTDTGKVYVYVGSESGYTNGNWYYYNGTQWVSGGAYNSTAVTHPIIGITNKALVIG